MDFRDPVYRYVQPQLLSEEISGTCPRSQGTPPALPHSDPYADPYYDYEMEALWRGGHYENFRVQYTEAPLPYHYSVSVLRPPQRRCSFTRKLLQLIFSPPQERERECDPRERQRDRDRERDHRERERRQREREREREREKERVRRKEEWEKDRMKRDEKERPRMRPPREPREKKEEEKLKVRPPLVIPPA